MKPKARAKRPRKVRQIVPNIPLQNDQFANDELIHHYESALSGCADNQTPHSEDECPAASIASEPPEQSSAPRAPRFKQLGRKPHYKTKAKSDQVAGMAGVGIPQSQIAHVLKIHEKTLRKHYREELTHTAIDKNFRVARTLFNKAEAGNIAACIFWLRTRAGFKYNQPALTPTDLPPTTPAPTPKAPPPPLPPCPIPVVRDSRGNIVE